MSRKKYVDRLESHSSIPHVWACTIGNIYINVNINMLDVKENAIKHANK